MRKSSTKVHTIKCRDKLQPTITVWDVKTSNLNCIIQKQNLILLQKYWFQTHHYFCLLLWKNSSFLHLPLKDQILKKFEFSQKKLQIFLKITYYFSKYYPGHAFVQKIFLMVYLYRKTAKSLGKKHFVWKFHESSRRGNHKTQFLLFNKDF